MIKASSKWGNVQLSTDNAIDGKCSSFSSVQFYESFEIENPVVIPFHLVEMIRNQRTESISIFTNYGDPHRIFVQSMLSRGIITYNEFTTLFEAIFRKCNVPLRSKLGTEKQKIFIKTVNEELEKKCNLKLFVGVDEESPKKNTLFWHV